MRFYPLHLIVLVLMTAPAAFANEPQPKPVIPAAIPSPEPPASALTPAAPAAASSGAEAMGSIQESILNTIHYNIYSELPRIALPLRIVKAQLKPFAFGPF